METEIQIRVRYNECDPMGVVHHAVYPIWFEMGRTELLREQGSDYRALEEQKLFLAVIDLQIKYKASAKYDDELVLRTILTEVTNVRIKHAYQLLRYKQIIASGTTTLACIDNTGKPQRIHPVIAAY